MDGICPEKLLHSVIFDFSLLYFRFKYWIEFEVKDFIGVELIAEDIFNFWKMIKSMKHHEKPRFPFLSRVSEILLTLPYSTAEIERLFSSLSLSKTSLRNRLNNETLDSLLNIKQSLKRKRVDFEGLNQEEYKKLKLNIMGLS